jgi:SnoaL-like protein
MSLEDKMDILEVIARYAYTYDERDADGFAQLFTEGAIFEVIPAGGCQPELRLETRAPFMPGWSSATNRWSRRSMTATINPGRSLMS